MSRLPNHPTETNITTTKNERTRTSKKEYHKFELTKRKRREKKRDHIITGFVHSKKRKCRKTTKRRRRLRKSQEGQR